MSDGSEAKTDQASQKKLRKQREEGSVAMAADTAMFAGIVAVVVTCLFAAHGMISGYLTYFGSMTAMLDLSFEDSARNSLNEALTWLASAIIPIAVATTAGSVLTSILYNKGVNFAMKPVLPNLSRVSMTAGFKRIYGVRGWLEFGTGLARLTVWISFAVLALWLAVPTILHLGVCSNACVLDVIFDHIVLFVSVLIVILTVAAIIDMTVQKFLFLSEQKMTKSETKRERKEQTGSPEVRRERKRLQREMMQGVEHKGPDKANMCVFSERGAIALRYHPDSVPVPRVAAVAKTPEAAAKLRAKIKANGFRETYNSEVVDSCRNTPLGNTISEESFHHVVKAMQAMYAR